MSENTTQDSKKTIYIKRLNEKVKLSELKESLAGMFSQFGKVLDVHVRSTIKTKGQAWIAFDNIDSALQAVNNLNGFEFYDKPMIISFAKKEADAVLKAKNKFVPRLRRPKGERERQLLKHKGDFLEYPGQFDLGKTVNQALLIKEKTTKQQQQQQQNKTTPLSDNPPNKILLLVNLPPECDSKQLKVIFGNLPGLVEIRPIPGRCDVAFVEYENEYQATQAKNTLQGYFFDQKHTLRILFAKAST